MSTGHSVIPIDDEQLAENGITEYLKYEMIFIPASIPRGRYPTPAELRQVIQELGYALEETQDWYVTSDDDSTEIWFKGDKSDENTPNVFWFRRGANIVWNITQSLANRCGSFLILNHSGSPNILFVPENLFASETPTATDYFDVITHRIPFAIERLPTATTEDKLFLLSQMRQAVRSTEQIYQFEFFNSVQQGVNTFTQLLDHEDSRIRFLAFDLVARFKERFFETAEALKSSILKEPDTATKTRMIYGLEQLLVPGWIGGEIYEPTKRILEILSHLNNDNNEVDTVRFATAQILALSQPGLLTPHIREIFINALMHPEQYDINQHSGNSIIRQVLKSIEKMLLNHRIDILITALPMMAIAQNAHEILCVLLDQVFFGMTRPTQRSSLPDTRLAERPAVDETKFDKNLPTNWLYPANPTKLSGEELLPFQRKVLETVIAIDLPWMVHSNLLEKYGLPPTRELVRELLNSTKGFDQ